MNTRLIPLFAMVFFVWPVYSQICLNDTTPLHPSFNISLSHYIEQNVNQIWTPVQITLKNIKNNPHLKMCYNSSFGKENLNIFTRNISDIIRIFFEKSDINWDNVQIRILFFMNNMRNLVKLVLKCIRQINQATPNLYGITDLFALTDNEWENFENKHFWDNFVNYTSNITRHKRENVFLDNCDLNWNKKLPAQFDWRKYGAVTKVKNQRKCGSCYAFASVSVLESAYIIAGKADNSLDLSEQQLLNCVGKCIGAPLDSLFEYMVYTGIPTESDLPYRAKAEACEPKAQTINANNFCIRATVGQLNHDRDIQIALLKYGPLFTAIGVNKEFKFLKGPYHGFCPHQLKNVRHAVTLVGWTKQYWILKNSWGRNWGQEGYVYLSRKPSNHCGINYLLAAPIVFRN